MKDEIIKVSAYWQRLSLLINNLLTETVLFDIIVIHRYSLFWYKWYWQREFLLIWMLLKEKVSFDINFIDRDSLFWYYLLTDTVSFDINVIERYIFFILYKCYRHWPFLCLKFLRTETLSQAKNFIGSYPFLSVTKKVIARKG